MPTLIEARCYRFMGHSMSDPVHGHYRTKEEVEEQKLKDPVRRYFSRLLEAGVIDQDGIEEMEPRSGRSWTRRWSSPTTAPSRRPSALYEDVYSEPYGPYTRSQRDNDVPSSRKHPDPTLCL